MFWKKKKEGNTPIDGPVVLRVDFQKFVPIRGHVVVEVPASAIEKYGNFRNMSESLFAKLLKKADIEWEDEPDFTDATEPLLEGVEWVTGDEWSSTTDSEPQYLCTLNAKGKWRISDITDVAGDVDEEVTNDTK
jgi:hypothetical protein